MSTPATEPGQEPGQQAGSGQGQAPAANGNQGQEPTGGQGQGQAPGQGNAEFDLNTIQDPALRAYLEKVQKDAKEAREEAAKYRTERNAFQAQVTEHQRANETAEQAAQREAQERQERLDALERENRALKVDTAIRKAAEDAKAFNPETVVGLLSAKVTLDDQGKPQNIADLLKALRESDAYLFRRTRTADAGEGGEPGSEPTGNMNDRIRDMARRGRATTT